ncbi:AAA family ATPase [Arthrobacter alpinus]|uniref:AAA family ATPase n=1 Tax=Arthrobacter alpinus TaxID=656366 RepID=UPI0016441E37|nr:AAA family ATPase [Arthrobacter alpinus]
MSTSTIEAAAAALATNPWLLSPEERDTQSRASLSEDLKNHRPRAKTEMLWKMSGFDIPTVETIGEAEALATQGLPSRIKIGDYLQFGPEVVIENYEAIVADMAAEFHMDAAAREADALAAPNRLKSVADMLKTPEIAWLVEDKIHAAGLTQIFGPSYVGKTLLVLDLIMSWSAGLPQWQGYKLCNDGKPQEAVYVAAEGGSALSVHIDAWIKYHPEVTPEQLSGLVFLDGGEGHNLFLSVGKNEVEAGDNIYRFRDEIVDLGISPSLVIFDTQIDLAPGIDENSNTDMVDVLRQVKRLGDSLGFMALVVHHTGHDGDRARGASGMKGKCDAMAKLSPIGEKSGKARLEWIKVKGRALPQDSISYEIQGWEKMPDLDSEGAVCVPISKLAAGIAEHQARMPSDEMQRGIITALQAGKLSKRALAEKLSVDKDSKELVAALAWMKDAEVIQITGKSSQTAYLLTGLAWAPSEY